MDTSNPYNYKHPKKAFQYTLPDPCEESVVLRWTDEREKHENARQARWNEAEHSSTRKPGVWCAVSWSSGARLLSPPTPEPVLDRNPRSRFQRRPLSWVIEKNGPEHHVISWRKLRRHFQDLHISFCCLEFGPMNTPHCKESGGYACSALGSH